MKEIYDVIIIGGGPAGLTAAIYTSRANLKTLILERELPGGKIAKTYEIENYPGLKNKKGIDLAMEMADHATKFGAEIKTGEVTSIVDKGETKEVMLQDGSTLETKTIIIATGTKERTLNLPRSDEFTGRGISYCAVCDGNFYRNKTITIIGGGNSALEEALYLSSLVKQINIVIRRDVFRADASVIDKILSNEKIKIYTKSVPVELVIENERIIGLKIKNVDTNEESVIQTDGIFPYIGADPCTSFIDKTLLNEHGYIVVDKNMKTKIDGIYAAGDVIDKELRQVVTATNDGAIAANSITKYLQK